MSEMRLARREGKEGRVGGSLLIPAGGTATMGPGPGAMQMAVSGEAAPPPSIAPPPPPWSVRVRERVLFLCSASRGILEFFLFACVRSIFFHIYIYRIKKIFAFYPNGKLVPSSGGPTCQWQLPRNQTLAVAGDGLSYAAMRHGEDDTTGHTPA
jgi:hypothetical protein